MSNPVTGPVAEAVGMTEEEVLTLVRKWKKEEGVTCEEMHKRLVKLAAKKGNRLIWAPCRNHDPKLN
jgi:hypothetical protein